ncbi:hypothetical protein AB4Y40_30145 [Paraburkholderia sp. EG287B]|uniref:hypothetical protein n=1 Tax=Paraburkholderia sp. EG287B TaxID=3237010 RepID=UPI0034D3081F
MENEHSPFPNEETKWAMARNIEDAVRAMRRAQGKKNPEDFPRGSPEEEVTTAEFLHDVMRAIDRISEVYGRKSGDDEPHGVGAAG